MKTKILFAALSLVLLGSPLNTTVADVLAMGNGPIWQSYGVTAPATLGSYKVFGPNGVLLYDAAVDGPDNPYHPNYAGKQMVAGASTSASENVNATLVSGSDECVIFNQYVFAGQANQSSNAILKIQQFLNSHQNAGLALSGVYDMATIEAVNKFQLSHASEVLTPWGLTTPTGNVYITTARAMNIVNCRMQGKTLVVAGPVLKTTKVMVAEARPVPDVSNLPVNRGTDISTTVDLDDRVASKEAEVTAPDDSTDIAAVSASLATTTEPTTTASEDNSRWLWITLLIVIALTIIFYLRDKPTGPQPPIPFNNNLK